MWCLLSVLCEDIKFKCAYFNPMCSPRFFVCRPCPAGPVFRHFSVLLLLGIAPRLAAEQFGDFTYSEDDSSVTITKYTGTGGEVAVPSEIDGKPVKAIGKDAFFYQQTITRLELPDNLATIGTYAFAACDGLTSLVIPQSVSWIDGGAFTHCFNLTSITFKGNAPGVPAQSYVFSGAENRLIMYYYQGATGFTSPKWQNHPVVQLALPIPIILSMARLPGKFSVTISGVAGKTYQLQRNTGPGPAGVWTPVFTTEPLTGPEAELTDTAALADSATYRVAENSP
ncbi:MAG: leucine-rich repeat domain-containing protein [Verrucomicrobiaceae bacterium]|nr:MAG: leucine-rich repeat domain-containing protein [Verrucomicrobiaceae bacterium]